MGEEFCAVIIKLNGECNAYKEQINKLRSENDIIHESLQGLAVANNRMLIEFNNLQKKYIQQRDKFGYIDWSAKNIANWIYKLDEERYFKYYNDLLRYLTKNDLHRLGITDFMDKHDVFVAIDNLIRSGINKSDVERIGKDKAMELKYDQMKIKYNTLEMEYEEALNQK